MSERLEIGAGKLSALIAPEIGGAIQRLDWADRGGSWPVLRGADHIGGPLEAACFPLVPFSNRIRGGRFMFRGRAIALAPNMAGDPSPLHGQGWLRAWQVQGATERDIELSFEHAPGEWPWRYRARQRFEVDDDGLTAIISCQNLSNEPMPCGLGFHPYFPCQPTTMLRTRVSHVWTVDENVLPVEKIEASGRYDLRDGPICGRALDNGYGGWGGRADIDDPSMPFALRLSSPDTHFFQLYSPAAGGLFVAEPVSHANDVLSFPEENWASLGLRILQAGETMTLRMRLDLITRPLA